LVGAAVAVAVPPGPFEGEAGLGDQLLNLATAGRTLGSRGIGKLLTQLEDTIAVLAVVLVKWHCFYILLRYVKTGCRTGPGAGLL
jgi:hypothetical protein